ncbi:MAG: aspartate/glutamate racemase family protein, partial [Myxococcota bacterium]
KTIGLIGGMSGESTSVYYQYLNRMARARLGGLHSAELVVWSFDFAQIEALQAAGDWDQATERMVDAAQRLERAGASCIVICTNTMHKMAEAIEAVVDLPLIHIADATAAAVVKTGVKKPLLLGTRFTMEQDFYRARLARGYGVEALIPEEDERADVHNIIYDELCQGLIRPESKQRYLEIVASAQRRGADGVIFGCTEVGLLIRPEDLSVDAFDTTELHAAAALDFALA